MRIPGPLSARLLVSLLLGTQVAGCSSPSDVNGPAGEGAVVLTGLVVDQFTGAGVAGAIVSADGRQTRTAVDGGFSLESSGGTLLVTDASIHAREAWLPGGGIRIHVLPVEFPLAAFDDVARERDERTVRWTRDPAIYVDVRPLGLPADHPQLAGWIEEVRRLAPEFVAAWSDGTLRPTIEVGADPPPGGTPGTIVIRFDESPERWSDDRGAGLARVHWGIADRAVLAAEIWLRFSGLSGPAADVTRRAMIGHELGHAVGLGHMEGSTASLMTAIVRQWDLTAFDRQAAAVLYGRPPGNTRVDRDPVGGAARAAAPAGPAIAEGRFEARPGRPVGD